MAGWSVSWGPLVVALPLWSFSAAVTADQIKYFEPFSVSSEAVVAGAARKAVVGSVRKAHFNAYGRRFDLTLEQNSKLTDALPAVDPSGPTQTLYRGAIDDVSGSWVRLSARGQVVRGMIWDGQELYIAELADVVRGSLDPALAAPATETVIFKLSDAVLDEGASFCATVDDSSIRGADAYKSLVRELKGSPAIQQAAGAGERLELSIYGDSYLLALAANEQNARDEILLRLNNVDGIFTAQLGIELQVPTMTIATADTDSLSDTTAASTLLNEIRLYRRQTPAFYARGLTHLFTGRNLDGNTVGIAYQGTLCSREYGAGVTEASGRGAWIESLIAAHEIGHNFGAGHDGDADSCPSTPTGQFIMSPSVNPRASMFSDCSVQIMRPRADNASCIVALPPADLSVPSDLGTVHHTVSTQFGWELSVSNSGGVTAIDAQVDFVVPLPMQIDGAAVAGGTCTSGAGAITCTLGDIPAGATRVVALTLHSDVVGTSSISAHMSAQNDAQTANDQGNGTVVIEAAGTPTPAPSAPSNNSVPSGGGGGGSTNPLWLAALAGLFGLRRKLAPAFR